MLLRYSNQQPKWVLQDEHNPTGEASADLIEGTKENPIELNMEVGLNGWFDVYRGESSNDVFYLVCMCSETEETTPCYIILLPSCPYISWTSTNQRCTYECITFFSYMSKYITYLYVQYITCLYVFYANCLYISIHNLFICSVHKCS